MVSRRPFPASMVGGGKGLDQDKSAVGISNSACTELATLHRNSLFKVPRLNSPDPLSHDPNRNGLRKGGLLMAKKTFPHFADLLGLSNKSIIDSTTLTINFTSMQIIQKSILRRIHELWKVQYCLFSVQLQELKQICWFFD